VKQELELVQEADVAQKKDLKHSEKSCNQLKLLVTLLKMVTRVLSQTKFKLLTVVI
jgi:hypothetical protein